MNNSNCKTCSSYSEGLELIASRYSLLYTSSITLSIFLSVFLLTKLIENEIGIIILGLLSVIFAIIPLIFKEKIEKVHGYTALAMEFKKLEQDFKNYGNVSKNLLRFKDLLTRLSDYPLDRYTKWRVKR